MVSFSFSSFSLRPVAVNDISKFSRGTLQLCVCRCAALHLHILDVIQSIEKVGRRVEPDSARRPGDGRSTRVERSAV